jgi:hypothetical protein
MTHLRSRLFKPRALGALRVLGLVILIQLIAVALWLRSAHARASEALLSVGAELMKIEGANPNPARSVVLNGLTVHLRTASTDHDLHSVLDRFHALCRARTGVQAPQAALDKLRGGAHSVATPALLDGVLRAESDSEGVIACVDTGSQLSLTDLTSRLQAFAETGDLNEVGELRYVLARRVDGKTAVLTLWTEGSTPLLEMFPASGDAPGQDPADISRPQGTRRLLSTWENGQRYSMTAYVAGGERVAELVAFYEQDFRSKGWLMETNAVGSSKSKVTTIRARRGGRIVLVRIGNDRRGAATVSVAVLA